MSFRSAQAARLDGVPEVLALVADEGRILISHDFQTMPDHFRQFTKVSIASPTGRSCRSINTPGLRRTLLLIWDASEADE
jgi:hypothetical protein